MRNFSSVVPTSRIYLVPFDLIETLSGAIHRYQKELLTAFETRDLASMTAPEREVMDRFLKWVRTLPFSRGNPSQSSNAAFVYTNLKTGVTLVFIVDYA